MYYYSRVLYFLSSFLVCLVLIEANSLNRNTFIEIPTQSSKYEDDEKPSTVDVRFKNSPVPSDQKIFLNQTYS